MGTEIERKFRVAGDAWRKLVAGEGATLRQFYLAADRRLTTRVRVVDGREAFLTLKTGSGLVRGEWEYAIPLADAVALEGARVGAVIAKRRHRIPLAGGRVVELDVFEEALAPLVLAEIELGQADEAVELPRWIGVEVTEDPAYANARLALDGVPPEPGATGDEAAPLRRDAP